MILRSAILATTALALAACDKQPEGERSLVGAFAAPGAHVMARDTIVVWRRAALPGGLMRLTTWTVEPGGSVQVVEEVERGAAASNADAEGTVILPGEKRGHFAIPATDHTALRAQAALLRPQGLNPATASGGYAGETRPPGCAQPGGQASGGINFLNDAGWGSFVLPAGCNDPAGTTFAEIVTRLERTATIG